MSDTTPGTTPLTVVLVHGAFADASSPERAGADITEAEGSHVIMVSHPEIVVSVIMEAVAAVGQPTVAAR